MEQVVGDIVKVIAIIVIWTGGYLAAPMIFMATLGVFRNLAGMGSGSIKKLSGRIRQPAQQRRAWGKAKKEELKQQKYVNKGASRWRTRRRSMQEDYRESSRALGVREELHEDLTTSNPTSRQERARKGMSDKVLRQARAEQSKEDLSQAQYQFERGGANVMGEEFHVLDENGNKVQAQKKDGTKITDQQGNAVYEWGKDAMSIEAVKGSKVVNARSGAVVADGSEGSQRAAAMNAAQQGLIEPLRAVQAEVGQRQAQAQQLAQAGDTAGAQASMESAAELQTVLSEAVQSNVGSVMPKADDLIKGKSAAFSRVTADKLGTYDMSTLETMIDWAEKEGSTEQIANLTSQLDTYISDPKRYGSQSAEALKAVKARISSVQVNDPDPQRAQAKQQLVGRVNNAPAGTKTIQPDGTIS